METPINSYYNQYRDTSTLYFTGERFSEYRMRGGVFFPQMYDDMGNFEIVGHIMMSGQDIRTKNVFVFEDMRFSSIEPLLNDDGMVEFPGVTNWLNVCWSKYYGRRFFFFQNELTVKKYRMKISRSASIGRKPLFIETDMYDTQVALGVVYQYIRRKKLAWQKKSVLGQELARLEKGNKILPPSVHALAVMLAGIEKSPYKEKK